MKSEKTTISLSDLLDESLLEKLQKLVRDFESVQELLYQLSELDAMETLHQIQSGTGLMLLFLQKVMQGKNPKTFTREDWFAMSQQAMDAAENTEDGEYCVIVFQAYAAYIDASALILAKILKKNRKDFDAKTGDSEENADEDLSQEKNPAYAGLSELMPLKIHQLAEEIRSCTEQFQNGEIKEAAYIESCLWIALEAMFKLLSSAAVSSLDPRIQHFANGLSAYAFEYGRLMLYQKEQALLQSYLEHQKVVDDTLQKDYDAFMQEMNTQAEQFHLLIGQAFAPSFRQQLHASAALAEAAGVSADEILQTTADVDAFFLD